MKSFALPFTVADRIAVRHFRQSLPHAARRAFDVDLDNVLASETEFAIDQATQSHIVFAASALCVYRYRLRENPSKEMAKEAIRRTITSYLKRTTAAMLWLSCVFSKDTFETVRSYTKDKSGPAYGASFDIDYTEIDNGFVSIVKACGYRAFLARHGADELIDVFCEWDKVWIDALPKSVAFRRPTTLAQGGKSCRFEFRKNGSR
ncbi:MAG: L-2-amino-thiazoline-4-carboxylic acid hydrolase [Pseudomonadota bacterium]